MTIRVDEEILSDFDDYAEDIDTSRSQLIEDVMENLLNNPKLGTRMRFLLLESAIEDSLGQLRTEIERYEEAKEQFEAYEGDE